MEFDRVAWADAARRGMGVAFAAARTPERPAVIGPTGDRSYAELNANANRLVRALRRSGLVAGDSVALLAANRAEFAETYAACTRAGFRLTTVNWHLTPDEAAYEWGESVLAVVERKPGVAVEPDELLAFCRQHLAGFKCPRAVDFVDHLSRDDNGKLYKRRLRDEYRARAAGI